LKCQLPMLRGTSECLQTNPVFNGWWTLFQN